MNKFDTKVKLVKSIEFVQTCPWCGERVEVAHWSGIAEFVNEFADQISRKRSSVWHIVMGGSKRSGGFDGSVSFDCPKCEQTIGFVRRANDHLWKRSI